MKASDLEIPPTQTQVDDLNRFRTSHNDCACPDYRYCDSRNFICDHMQIVRRWSNQLQRVVKADAPINAPLQPWHYEWALPQAKPAKAPAKRTLSSCKYSLNFRTKYHTTKQNCDCPASGKALPCKHRQLLTIESKINAACRRHIHAASKQGVKAMDARLAYYYQALGYHMAQFKDQRKRTDGLAVHYLTHQINRWERRAGLDTAKPIKQRLVTFQQSNKKAA